MDYLSNPTRSIPSVQTFSKASDQVTKRRTRIEPDTAVMSMCLKYWLGLKEITDEEVGGAEAKLEMRLEEARERQAAGKALQDGSRVEKVDHEGDISSSLSILDD
jgi:hypothetical protein